jgi:hypothetical protein
LSLDRPVLTVRGLDIHVEYGFTPEQGGDLGGFGLQYKIFTEISQKNGKTYTIG